MGMNSRLGNSLISVHYRTRPQKGIKTEDILYWPNTRETEWFHYVCCVCSLTQEHMHVCFHCFFCWLLCLFRTRDDGIRFPNLWWCISEMLAFFSVVHLVKFCHVQLCSFDYRWLVNNNKKKLEGESGWNMHSTLWWNYSLWEKKFAMVRAIFGNCSLLVRQADFGS